MQGVEIRDVTSAMGSRHAPGVRLTSALAIPSPFKRDRVRRIDCVIDYFGGGDQCLFPIRHLRGHSAAARPIRQAPGQDELLHASTQARRS